MKPLVRRFLAPFFILLVALGVGAVSPPLAAAEIPEVQNCGANTYVKSIDVKPKEGTDSNFYIVVTPTDSARKNGLAQNRNTTVSMWHQIQSCVPGLYGDLADSIWQQLECHQHYAVDKWTGSTYDLETWRYPLNDANYVTYANSRCLNREWLFGAENGDPTVLLPTNEYSGKGGGGW
ncbi:DUF2599 domain-containing protein [Rhodococcus sp. 06-1460-1B]|uniref:DUF2599 domain-containing protein n=1 Tax=Rhodococcus sp. 06-1460-1B TaxID=2022501 RepID=UPI000B9BA0E2|nr:DUF2599 domain-containing protein [Rhodococcus sp. 06-1460-1B]OZD68186.1 hypothetical protein CH268_00020 [Rhodococcus sp. 06-1460-1B]